MKLQSAIFLLLVIMFTDQESAFIQKIYVSPPGNDTDPGTVDKPLATLAAALDKGRESRKAHFF